MTGQRLRVRGLVQGVGFRPYVWRLAYELGLGGWVRNDAEGVTLVVQGARVDEFLRRLPLELPRLARIDHIEVCPDEGAPGEFRIVDSDAGDPVATAIGPDAALCRDCMADLFDRGNRRWRYAFTTCTHCGPRYTVSRRIPYDRRETSLAGFALCPDCTREYQAPQDRRFHAETTCCPTCGPQLQWLDAQGRPQSGDPIAGALRLLQDGAIVAIKGLGGFHLACDARNAQAVATLRQRKQREAKPLAVMALNAASLDGLARVGPAEQALLDGTAAPIVLCPQAGDGLAGVAPGLAWLGVLWPSTPLHLLLWHEAAGQPEGTGWLDRPHPLLLVMSSANPHGEPLVRDNAEALVRLQGIADGYLLHDRDIVVRCDDSVVRAGPSMIRRARGYTPVPVPLTLAGTDRVVLAMGAYLKTTVCVRKGASAYLSQHVGGLDNAAARQFYEESLTHLLAILALQPQRIAHDLHPDYPSTQLGMALAERWGVQALGVGHHHAHIGAVCAEHGLQGPVLGLAIDGVGLGPNGGLWGGELLRVDGAHCERLGHLRPLRLPGGDRAAREPWRMAVSVLHRLGRGAEVAPWLQARHPQQSAGPLLTMLERGLNAPWTTSLGRCFDAAAGLLGLRALSQYEGQAAMELESLAARHGPVPPLPGGFVLDAGVLDFLRLLAVLADAPRPDWGAALFHATLAEGLAEWLAAASAREGLRRVAVGGGCAMNALLMQALALALHARGLTLFQARQVPPNDGGLALGQAWVAAH